MHPTYKTVSKFTLYSAPCTAGPPNGCLPREEEVIATDVEIYEADYYGKGPKKYASGSSRVCNVDGTGERPNYGGWSEGNLVEIAKLEAARDEYAALAAEPLTPETLRGLGFELYGYESRAVGATYSRSGVLRRMAVYSLATRVTPHRVAVALQVAAKMLPTNRRVVMWRDGALCMVGLVQMD